MQGYVHTMLESAGFSVRYGVAGVAVLLLFRSLGAAFLPLSSRRHIRPLLRLTEHLLGPVRRMLPRALRHYRMDYSPLLTAMYLLAIGYGISLFLFQIAAVF
ncbi:MAG: hypothetical protein ACYC9O_04825 [Candidatus Latescibacterota bacterium]